MPLELSASILEEEVRRVTVDLPDPYNQKVWVDYIPSRYDWHIERIMVEDLTRLPAGGIKEFILKFIVGWDLTFQGEMIPITEEGLKRVDLFRLQLPIASAVLDDLSEGKALRTDSRSRSRTGNLPPKKPRQKARLQAVQ